MVSHILKIQLLGLSLAAVFGAGCGDDEKLQGTEGGACFPNGTCNLGLECRSNLCVDLTPGSTDHSNGTDPYVNYDDCFGCGEESCATEASACEDAGGCDDVLKCYLDCEKTDVSCLQQCATGLSNEMVLALGNYWTCIGLNCVQDCTPQIPTDNDGSDGSDGSDETEACTGNETRGSCAEQDAKVCVDGVWQNEDCGYCDIIYPTLYCGEMSAFVLDSAYDAVPGDLAGFEQSSTYTSAAFDFSSSSNVGFIQLKFGELRALSYVYVDAMSGSGLVDATLENSDSSNGCEYTISSSGLLSQTTSDYCWGDAGYDPLNGSTSALINVRLHPSSTGMDALAVSGLTFQ